jgi:hypothetical protein
MALSVIVLLYVAARVAEEIAGRLGILVLVAAFLGFEALLFWTTRRRLQDHGEARIPGGNNEP